MTGSIPSQEILPNRPAETEPKLREVEDKLLALKNKKEEKSQTLTESKSELDTIRSTIDALEKEEGIDTERLAVLRTSLAEIALELEKEAVPASEGEAVAAEPKPVVETWYKPSTWSSDHRSQATSIAIAGGIAVGGLLLFKALSSALKKGKEKIGNATKKGWSALLWIAGGVTVAGAAYLGIRSWQRLTTVTRITAEIERQKEKLATEVGAVREKTEKHIEALEALLAKKLSDQAATPRPEDPKESTSPLSPNTSPAIDTLKENAAEDLREFALARSLIEFHPFEWEPLSKRAKQNQVNDILANNREGPSMKDILTWAESPSVGISPLTSPTSDPENRKKALELVADFCVTHEQGVLQYLVNREKLSLPDAEAKMNTLTLAEYLQCAIRSSSALFEVIDTISDSNSISELTQNLRDAKFTDMLAADLNVEDALKNYLESQRTGLGISEEDLKNVRILDILGAATELPSKTVQGELQRLQALENPTSAEKILAHIFSSFESGDTHQYLLTCFHGIFPTNEGSEPSERVRNYLRDRMSPGQALRFFLYRSMIDDGNPTGLVLMQTEVIKFIGDYDETSFIGESKYQVILRLGEKMASLSSEKLEEEWREAGIVLPPDLFAKAETMLRTTGSGIVNLGTKGAKEAVATNFAVAKEHWLAGSVITGLLLEGGEQYHRMNVNTFMTKEILEQWAGSLPTSSSISDPLHSAGNWLREGSRILPAHRHIAHASEAYLKIYEDVTNMRGSQQGKVTNLLRSCLSSPTMASRWEDLATELKAVGLNDAAKKARLFAKSPHMRRVVSAVAMPFRLGLTTTPRWLYNRTRGFALEAGRTGIDVTKDAYTALRSSPFIGDALKAVGETLENFLSAVTKAKMPPQLAALFAKSKGGMRMLVDAFRRAGAPGIAYITKLANCVPFAKLTGPVGVGFDAIFILLERSMLEGKIQETDSAALKEFYEEQKNLTSVSLVPTAGFLALGTGPGFLLAGTYVGAKATSDYFNKATIDWLKNDKDMAKLPPGELLSKLSDITPGTQAYNHQNAARGDSLFGGSMLQQAWQSLTGSAKQKNTERFETVEKTNNGQRGKLTQAYLANMTEFPARSDESQAQYAERFARFQSEQNVFIARVSGGNFGPQRPEMYRKAHGHAELALLSRELTAKNTAQFIPLTHDEGSGHFVSDGEFDLRSYDELPPFGKATAEGLTRDDVIASWLRHQEAVTMAEAALTPESLEESKSNLIRHRLLQSLRYEVSALDAKLATADLKGWEWTGGEQSTREKIRSAARGAFMDRLSKESALLATTADGGLDEIRQSITRLRSFLQEDIAVFVALADKVSTTEAAEAGLDWKSMAAETLAA